MKSQSCSSRPIKGKRKFTNLNMAQLVEMLCLKKRYPRELLAAAINSVTAIDSKDCRMYWLGALGIRHDGAIVMSKNAPSKVESTILKIPTTHAEGRCLLKMDNGGVLYVARISVSGLAMARPCEMCQLLIKSKQIKKVYYTINNTQYGIWDPAKDTDVVKNT
jgi:tRNA(Arg) A34 adenosine deaminase TadA